jgi:hypothetical protein
MTGPVEMSANGEDQEAIAGRTSFFPPQAANVDCRC